MAKFADKWKIVTKIVSSDKKWYKWLTGICLLFLWGRGRALGREYRVRDRRLWVHREVTGVKLLKYTPEGAIQVGRDYLARWRLHFEVSTAWKRNNKSRPNVAIEKFPQTFYLPLYVSWGGNGQLEILWRCSRGLQEHGKVVETSKSRAWKDFLPLALRSNAFKRSWAFSYALTSSGIFLSSSLCT